MLVSIISMYNVMRLVLLGTGPPGIELFLKPQNSSLMACRPTFGPCASQARERSVCRPRLSPPCSKYLPEQKPSSIGRLLLCVERISLRSWLCAERHRSAPSKKTGLPRRSSRSTFSRLWGRSDRRSHPLFCPATPRFKAGGAEV